MAKDNKTFNNEQIRQLAEILTDTGLSEIEVEQDGLKIRVAREIVATYAAQATQAAPAVQAPGPAATNAPSVSAPEPSAGKSAGTVYSPMVGTAYMSPSPEAAPFVQIGSEVKAGQAIMIIEAMKRRARQKGATSMRVEATIANPALLRWLRTRLGSPKAGKPPYNDVWELPL